MQACWTYERTIRSPEGDKDDAEAMCFQQRGHSIYVNPALVRVVREVNDTTTAIEFANDHVLQIAVPLEKVHEKLNEAMNNS
jgi:hypothetical protein